jgi:PAS domain S-box-containing protein
MKAVRFFRPVALLFLLVAITRPVLARAQAEAATAVVLTDKPDNYYPLGKKLDILEDPGGQLTIEEVASPAWADRFVTSQDEVPNYGFSSSAYWVRVRLRNEAQLEDEWRLEVGFANMHYVDFYRPAADGSGFEGVQTGLLRPVDSRDIRYHRFVFGLPLAPGQEQTVYLRFASGASMTLPLALWSRPEFEESVQGEFLRLGFLYGVLGAMLVYNLFLLLSLREQSYFYYCLFLAAFILFQSAYDGTGPRYLWPFLTAGNRFPILLFYYLFFFFLLGFTMAFLQTKQMAPRIHRFLTVLRPVFGFFLVLVPFTSYRFAIVPGLFVGVLTLAVMIVTSVISWRRGYRPAAFFLAAWLVFLVGALLVILVRARVLPSMEVTEQVYQFGIILAGLLLSLALADQINVFKADTEKASRNLADSEKRLAQFLEAMPVGVTVFDATGRLYYINQLARRFIGPAEPVSMGQTVADIEAVTPFYVAGSRRPYPEERLPLQRALEGEATMIDDLEVAAGEQRIPFQVWGSPVRNEAGQVEYAITAFQNINKRQRAEAALRDSEERYRTLVTQSRAAIYLYDPDSQRVLEANPAFCQLLGYTIEEAAGLTLYDFIVLERADLDRRLEQIHREGGASLGERPWRRKDGTLVYVHITIGSFQQAGRTLFCVVAQDIRAIKALEERLAAIYRLGQELVLLHDETAILQRVVQAIGNTLPFDLVACHLVNEATGKLINRYQLADGMIEEGSLHLSLDSAQSINVAVVQSGQAINLGDTSLDNRYLAYPGHRPYRSELCVPMKLGKLVVGTFNVESAALNQYTPADQELLQALATQATVALENAYLFKAERQARQLAETLRAANLALSESLELDSVLTTLLDYLARLVPYDSASIFLLEDQNRLVIYAQRGYGRWRRADDQQVIGLAFDVQTTAGMQTMVQTGQSLLIADTKRYPGWVEIAGSEYIRSWLGVPLVAGGQMIGLYSLDHSQPAFFGPEHVQLAETLASQAAVAIQNALLYRAQREQADRLHLSQSQLLQAEKMAALGRLAASIAHEINNPLQSIQGLLALLGEGSGSNGQSGEVKQYLTVINDEIERIAWVVRDMGNFARPTGGDRQPIDVRPIMESVLLLTAKQLQQSNIQVEWERPADLPAIWASAGRLKQVFLNLILNAIDSMPEGGRLRLVMTADEKRSADRAEAVPALRITFTDSGVGMTAEVLARIFEPFYTTKEQGNGLGLAVSYGIIEAHGGHIEAASEVGRGTTFTILLPMEPIR